MTMLGTPFAGDAEGIELNDRPYRLFTQFANLRAPRPAVDRPLSYEMVDSGQEVDSNREARLHLTSFDGGYGFTEADAPGTYEQADGWDASVQGRATTWPVLNTGQAVDVGDDQRGFSEVHGGYLYYAKGRYIAKFAPSIEAGDEWAVIELLDINVIESGAVAAGRPVAFDGDLHVPIKIASTGAASEFLRLDTVASHVTEQQTLTVTGSPATGTWTATFQGTTSAVIAIDATAAAVQVILRAMPGLAYVTVARTGSSPNFVYTVTMTGVGPALSATSPPAFTAADTFDTGGVTPATTVGGTCDTWERGPTNEEALKFVRWSHPVAGPVIVRCKNNEIAYCATGASTLTEGNWSTPQPVGDTGFDINELVVWDRDLVVGKEDGRLYVFDPQGRADPVPNVQGGLTVEDWQNMVTWGSFVHAPTVNGLWRWRPGAAQKVGAERDGRLDGARSNGWGRVMGLAEHGDRLYYVLDETYSGKSSLCSFIPRPRSDRMPYTPHMHQLYDTPSEDVVVVSIASQALGAQYPTSSPTSNDAVGTVAWNGLSSGAVPNMDGSGPTIVNHGADGGTRDYWYGLLGSTVTADATQFRTGAYSMKVVTAGAFATSEGIERSSEVETIAVTPGVGYMLTVYVKGTAGNVVKSVIDWFASEGGAAVSASFSDEYTLTGGWDLLTLVATAPAGATVACPGVRPSGTHGYTFYVDDFHLETGRASYATLPGETPGTTEYLDWVIPISGIPENATINGIKLDIAKRGLDLDGGGVSIVDNVVSLKQASSVAGDDKASATAWTDGEFVYETYGGPSDLWGLSWTPADFASGFGAVLSATVTEGQAQVDGIAARVYFTAAGSQEPTSIVVVGQLSADRTTVTPTAYQLPRAGLDVANDPLIAKAIQSAEFRTPRFDAPGRDFVKLYRSVEVWLDMEPQSNTPGVEVWAQIDDGDAIQLLDSDGAAATLLTTGGHEVFFPASSVANGRYAQVRFIVPAVAGSEVPVAVSVRDVTIAYSYRVAKSRVWTATLHLGDVSGRDDFFVEMRSIEDQRATMDALSGEVAAPTKFKIAGVTGYCTIINTRVQEVWYTGVDPSEWIAVVTLREEAYA